MAQTNFWQQIWKRGQNKLNTGPEPLDPETEANLRNRGLITDKGQTFDPNRPNYIGPSNTGKSPTSLIGDAVILAASASTVRKPTWALEAIGALTANPGDFSDQALYNIDRLRLQQALGNKLRGAKVVANTVLDIAKSELSPGLRLAGAGADVPVSKGGDVFQAVSDTTKQSEPYINWRTRGELQGAKNIKRGIKQPMKGFEHFTASDGKVYRLGTETSSKTGKTKYVVIDVKGRKLRDLKRSEAVKLDNDTLLRQFGGDKKLFKSYKSTNKKVINEVRNRISAINKANAGKPGWVDWQVEHVVDAQHYNKLGELLPNFSGKGADELGNLTLIRKTDNARTGAQAMKIDAGDALLDAVKKNKLVDYTQTTEDFMSFKLGDKVKNMKPKDWDLFVNQAVKNPTTNFHELLKNF